MGTNYLDVDPKEPSTHHEYDGIKENDNPMPGWWLATFYITIIFAALYYGYYELGGGPTLLQEYQAEMQVRVATAPKAPVGGEVADEEVIAVSKSPAQLGEAKAIYLSKCASCHRPDGGGLVGPNLTDDFWIHGGRPSQIYKVIHTGVLDKGMPAWNALLKAEEIKLVAGYVVSLHGTNPAGAKAPQGEKGTP